MFVWIVVICLIVLTWPFWAAILSGIGIALLLIVTSVVGFLEQTAYIIAPVLTVGVALFLAYAIASTVYDWFKAVRAWYTKRYNAQD